MWNFFPRIAEMLALFLSCSSTAWTLPSVSVQRAHAPLQRRQLCEGAIALGMGLLLRPVRVSAEAAPLTSSQMLTVGQYLVDLREARRGCELLKPDLELQEESAYAAVRIALRKPPIAGIRKAANKIVLQLDGGSLKSTKEKQYEAIKDSLGALDDACRPGMDRSVDTLALLSRLEVQLDAFIDGFGIAAAP